MVAINLTILISILSKLNTTLKGRYYQIDFLKRPTICYKKNAL